MNLIFHTDGRQRIRSWGNEIAEYTGHSEPDVVGRKYYDVLPRIVVARRDALAHALKSHKPLTLSDYAFHCLCGCAKADVTITPVHRSGTRIDGLEISILPQSSCAADRESRQSRKFIDIGIIAQTLAHGVRNPLNAIKGAVVYLREKYAGDGTLAEFTRIMETEVSRLERFISGYLSSSVSETDTVKTDVNVLLKKIDLFTSLQLYAKNIRARYELGDDIPSVAVNSFYLEQAVLNVINNAIEAMREEGRLHVKTSVEHRSGRAFVVLAVSDTGPGLPAGFHRLSAPKPGRNGRGFGLVITREIVTYYGWQLDVESRENQGTTVKLWIPCPPAPVGTVSLERSEEASSSVMHGRTTPADPEGARGDDARGHRYEKVEPAYPGD